MSYVAIVTGTPGSGKSTVCSRLAQTTEKGVHIHGDDFYRYVSDLIPPTDPASKDQNTTIITAILRAARTYAEAGYRVYLDGIFGPWFMPLIRQELEQLIQELEGSYVSSESDVNETGDVIVPYNDDLTFDPKPQERKAPTQIKGKRKKTKYSNKSGALSRARH